MDIKCANCGTIVTVENVPKKYICMVCGVLNTPQPENVGTGDTACGCLLPEGLEWKLPAGEKQTPLGPMYATADDGTWLTRIEWIETFGFDPKIALEAMRKMGKEGVEGFFNTSTLGRR